MSAFSLELRPRYGEVDRMGIVYHAHYLVYFDQGRTEFLRALGLPYAEIEERGFKLVVVDAGVRYLSPARYDEDLQLEVRLEEVRPASVLFRYELRRGETRLAAGHTRLGCVDDSSGPTPLPADLRRILAAGRSAPDAASKPT